MADPAVREVPTPVGPARVSVHRPGRRRPRSTLVLGHGAGGQSWSADIRAVTEAMVADRWTVVLVDQPWRVAGRRVASPPATLDRAWVPVIEALRTERDIAGALVVGGRSAGARVACRTAAQVGAAGVLCLSFPLHPPSKPERLRADELRLPVQAGLPVRVVQGERDPFGGPDEVAEHLPRGCVTPVPGTHTLTRTGPVVDAVRMALAALSSELGVMPPGPSGESAAAE